MVSRRIVAASCLLPSLRLCVFAWNLSAVTGSGSAAGEMAARPGGAGRARGSGVDSRLADSEGKRDNFLSGRKGARKGAKTQRRQEKKGRRETRYWS